MLVGKAALMAHSNAAYGRTAAGVPQLALSFVAFVDVLGVKEHATGADAGTTLATLDAGLRTARKKSEFDLQFPEHHASWFSDNLAICCPLQQVHHAETLLGTMLRGISWLELSLAVKGFFLRGGLAAGEHFADDLVSFGPALVDAVELERLACRPRVILGESMLPFVQEFVSYYSSHTDAPLNVLPARDAGDEVTFANYLAVALHLGDEARRQLLEQHRDSVRGQLHVHNGGDDVSAKYAWVAAYHDWFIAEFAASDGDLALGSASSAQLERLAD